MDMNMDMWTQGHGTQGYKPMSMSMSKDYAELGQRERRVVPHLSSSCHGHGHRMDMDMEPPT